ncbi:MAG: endonuclease III [Armatimonadetes bacterium]|nr:endonuclease III [Armatimonadota bacterium]MDW8152763.1 endonuclease III [Armatimonadota bacterium]
MPVRKAALPRETPEQQARRVRRIREVLQRLYPDPQIPLHHRSPFELLIATILSARCTDEMVNRVTPQLFARFPTPHALARADLREVERLVRPTGFYRQKARTIQATSRALVDLCQGEVPPRMEELVKLPGVGRKTANVLFSAAEIEGWPGWPGIPQADGSGIVVDTHVARLSQRLGLSAQTDPEKIERDLMALVPPQEWGRFALRLILFGRQVCTARAPKCATCPLREVCPSAPYAGNPPWMRKDPR